tara:strand:- start:1002 stop:1556 length:555 start_codon:yes stop_codon:yes gene_type:complete
MEFDNSSIHLAVEGSCGGTTLGLQVARQTILDGGRVLWASSELPDGVRFSQIFSDVSPTESSRFHAMNLVGNLDQAVDSLLKTANSLPNVTLLILDDYCPSSGQISGDIITAVNKLILNTSWTTLLISKGGVSMDSTPLIARGKNKLNTDKVWLLTRPESNSKRVLWSGDDRIDLQLKEEGFLH